MRLAQSLVALSLNANPNPTSGPCSAARPPSDRPNTIPARLSSLRDAARARLHQARDDLAMFSRQNHNAPEVIDISSDDDPLDTIHIKPSRQTSGPFAAQNHHLNPGNDFGFQSELDDVDSVFPLPLRMPSLKHRRRKSDHERLFGINATSSPPLADQAEYERNLLDTSPTRHHRRRPSPPRSHQPDNHPEIGFSTGHIWLYPGQFDGSSEMRRHLTASDAPLRRGVAEPDPCPYYHDPKFGVHMYRGPGYERFPVVLGTVEGHKELCELWDSQHKIGPQTTSDAPLSFKSQDSSLNATLAAVPTRKSSLSDMDMEQQCLIMVLDIFPQVSHELVHKLYIDRHGSTPSDSAQISSQIIADIAEMDTYPREKARKRKLELSATDDTGVTILWKKNVPKNGTYCREAVALLAAEFDHVPTHHIHKVVLDKKSLFDAFDDLSACEETYFADRSRSYSRMKRPRKTLEKKYQRPDLEQPDTDLHAILVNELQAARQSQAREVDRIKKQKLTDEEEANNVAIHIAQGSMVECQCCFDEVPINRTVPCEGQRVHFFCNDCVKRQAESQLASMKYEMRCMDTGGCVAHLSNDCVAQAVSIQVYDKLTLNQQRIEIAAAAIDGLEECPFCDFKAVCDLPIYVNSVFDCQNPDCAKSSCRKCKEESHLPKTCEEVRNDKGLSARHAVEEARSEAMMRTCPKCNVKIIKEYGCNKMVCTGCRAVMCYVCKKDISANGTSRSYDHFQSTGGTCALHDGPTENRHQNEADAAETAAIAKAKAEDASLDEKSLQIEAHLNVKQSRTIAPPIEQQGIIAGHGFEARRVMNLVNQVDMLRGQRGVFPEVLPAYPIADDPVARMWHDFEGGERVQQQLQQQQPVAQPALRPNVFDPLILPMHATFDDFQGPPRRAQLPSAALNNRIDPMTWAMPGVQPFYPVPPFPRHGPGN